MKTLAIIALATTLASPVLAQSYDPDLGSGNIAPLAAVPAHPAKTLMNVRDAFAQSAGMPGTTHGNDVLSERAKGNIE